MNRTMLTSHMKKAAIGLILLLILAQGARSQGARYDGVAQRTIQNFLAPIPGALITVCTSAGTGTPCTPTASIYLDQGLTQVASNPFTADSNGNFGFWAAAGTTYKYSITATGVTGALYTIVLPQVSGGTATFSNVNNTKLWDGTKYPYTDAGLRSIFSDCTADAQCTFIDGRNFLATTLASPAISITNKTIELWLGPATLTCANTCFNFGNGTDGSGITCFGNCTLNNSSTTGAHTIIAQGTGGTYARMLHFRGIRFTGAAGSGDAIHAVQSQNVVAELNLFDGQGSSAVSLTKSLEWNIRNNFIEGTYTFYAILLQSDGTAAGGSNENWVTFNTINGAQNGCTDVADSSYNVIAFNDEATCVNASDVDMNQISSSVATPVGNVYYHNVGETGVTAGDFLHCNGGVGFGPIGTVYDGNQFGQLGSTRVMLRVDRCDQTVVQNNRLFETQPASTTAFVNGSLATNTYFGFNMVPATNTTYLTDNGAATWGCLLRLCTQYTLPLNMTIVGTQLVGSIATFAGTVVAQSDVQARLNTDGFARIQLQSSTGCLLLGPGNSSTHLLLCNTTPTISSHFNTSGDSISANGTASFVITVGTGAATTNGAITLPTSATGWNCWLTNTNRADLIQQTASATNSATFTNFGTTFVATGFTNGDVLRGGCTAN